MKVLRTHHIILFMVLIGCAALIPVPRAHPGTQSGEENDRPSMSILPRAGEKPVSLETEKLDRVGEQLGRQIDEIGNRASRGQSMHWVDDEVFLGITWLKLLACVGIFIGVLIAERLFTFWVRSVLRGFRAGWKTLRLSGVSVRPLSRPFSLLVWVYGAYAALSPLYAHFERADGSNPFHDVMRRAIEVGGLLALVWLLYVLFRLGGQVFTGAGVSPTHPAGVFWTHCRKPVGMLLILVLMRILLPLLETLPVLYLSIIDFLSVLIIASVAWLAIGALSAMEDLIKIHYRIDEQDNLSARRVQTQVRLVRKFFVFVVVVIGAASMLMLSDRVRQLGTGILTSAGVLGIVVGLAAQRSIANLLVGLQIAVTQPIRIDDVVIIENEWGRVEEITSTYVTVRLWDLRRLVVPLTYFIEKPFQNWTRTSAEILGTVFLHTDYGVDVEAVRRELLSILQRSALWDGKVWGLQVTNARESGLELRALMSAADASMAWDLRCEVREKLVLFLQKNHPSSLPRFRVEMRPPAGGEPADCAASSRLIPRDHPVDQKPPG
ncbi:MAG: mechanosensitive ion channel family protein [Syntrophobacteraceae bacterium]|nr:mechanosensitive ion channel family protein [Syntrophobacteraceae bacterium]